MSGGGRKRIDDNPAGLGQGNARKSTSAPLIQWNYRHPRYGTCIPGCDTYEKCHCGCEGQTNLSHKTSAPRSQQRNQPAVFITGHAASIISAAHRESRTPDCHPDREHEARGMCASCYKQWRKNGGERIRIKRISSKRLNWEALRYKRCLELLWEYGYGKIDEVIQQLDKELPEEAA